MEYFEVEKEKVEFKKNLDVWGMDGSSRGVNNSGLYVVDVGFIVWDCIGFVDVSVVSLEVKLEE